MTQVLTLDINPDSCVALIEHEPKTSEVQEEPQIDIAEVISKATEELFKTTWEIFNTESPRKFLRVLRIPHAAIDPLRDFFYLCGVLCAWFIAEFVLHVEPEPRVLEFKPMPLLADSELQVEGERCGEEPVGGDTLQVKRLADSGSDEDDQGYVTSEDMPVDSNMASGTEDVAAAPLAIDSSQARDGDLKELTERIDAQEKENTTEEPNIASYGEKQSEEVEKEILAEMKKIGSDSEVDENEVPIGVEAASWRQGMHGTQDTQCQ